MAELHDYFIATYRCGARVITPAFDSTPHSRAKFFAALGELMWIPCLMPDTWPEGHKPRIQWVRR